MRVSAPRRILGTIAGILLGLTTVAIFEWAGSKLFPLPAGVTPENKVAFAQALATMPAGAFFMVLAGWFFGTLLATLVARRIAHSSAAALIAAAVLLAGGVVTMLSFPHPLWFVVTAAAVYAVATWGGWRLGERAVVEA